MLVYRLRRWPNIKTTLVVLQYIVLTGVALIYSINPGDDTKARDMSAAATTWNIPVITDCDVTGDPCTWYICFITMETHY